MRILVTGGTGMVGSHIQDLVNKARNKARNKDNELTDEEKNILLRKYWNIPEMTINSYFYLEMIVI